jgi:hypothetical protein
LRLLWRRKSVPVLLGRSMPLTGIDWLEGCLEWNFMVLSGMP